ncbi:uncharacterized protein LOC130759090 isoform X2 [Actinidia eriantha]|uniref:uncharacterized protein LOC130759090 isoform X2 n=1 Tax=Actinidia eriantha TaxID=165200 RepID=UPI0025828A09|nr:uncharacterized protein LOC130759090 isoform X2 [Actinidia eriantha]
MFRNASWPNDPPSTYLFPCEETIEHLSLSLIDEIMPVLGFHFSQMDRDMGDSDGGGEGHSRLPSDSLPRDPLSGGEGGFRPMRGGESDSDHQRQLFGQKRRSPGD